MANIFCLNRDGGERTWHPPSQACKFLKLKYHLHYYFEEKRLVERTIQYIKDRTKEVFDDYFLSCRKKIRKIKLKHVKRWLILFSDYYNSELTDQLYRPIRSIKEIEIYA